MALVTTAVVGCAYGLAHGLAPDHCAALATVLVRGDSRRAAVTASVRFGLGHAGVLGVLALAAVLGGWLVPPAWEQAAEIGGGALLVLLGALALARGLPLVIHRHAHEHARQAHAAHAHWHAHVGAPHHDHRHAGLLGGLFALSGVRALALVVAPLLLETRSAGGVLTFVVAFGLGVTLAMVAFGLAFHAGHRRVGAGGRDLATAAVGAVSLVVGGAWLWTSLG